MSLQTGGVIAASLSVVAARGGDPGPLRCAPAWVFEHPRGRLRGAIGEASGDIVFRDPVPDSSPTGPILIALSIGGLRKDVVP